MKLQEFSEKRTASLGLWWHPELCAYRSQSISLAQLKAYKGNVVIFMRKNRYYENGKNCRPNYIFTIADSKMASAKEAEVEDVSDDTEHETKYVFNEKQLTEFLNYVAGDVHYNGLDSGDLLARDYDLTRWCDVIEEE